MDWDAIDGMVEELAATAAQLDGVTHRLLAQIRAFDAADGWHHLGALSCAHFLSWRIGMGLGAAREKVRVARALGELPRIDAELAAGQLSYSKVRALTRVATPENEDELIEIARSSTGAQLEKIVRLYRQALGPSPAEDAANPSAEAQARAQAREDARWVRARPTDDGMVRITAQLLPEEAELVMAAIDGARRALRRPAVSAETPDTPQTPETSVADALVALAEGALAEGALAGGHPRLASAGRGTTEVLVHIDAHTMTGRLDASGHGLSAETCHRLLCDAGIVPILEDEHGATIDVGRRRRTIPAALRRALHARDGGCTFPGCTNRRVDAHHIEPWERGGATRLSNLVSVCRRHHRALHEGGFTVRLDAGGASFCDPRGLPIPAAPPPASLPVAPPISHAPSLPVSRPASPPASPRVSPPASPGVSPSASRLLHGTAAVENVAQAALRAPPPGWDGTRPDYDWIVSALCHPRRRSARC